MQLTLPSTRQQLVIAGACGMGGAAAWVGAMLPLCAGITSHMESKVLAIVVLVAWVVVPLLAGSFMSGAVTGATTGAVALAAKLVLATPATYLALAWLALGAGLAGIGYPIIPMGGLALVLLGAWVLSAGTTALGLVRAGRKRERQFRARAGLCQRCGYDLRGTLAGGRSVCPECGAPVFGRAAREPLAPEPTPPTVRPTRLGDAAIAACTVLSFGCSGRMWFRIWDQHELDLRGDDYVYFAPALVLAAIAVTTWFVVYRRVRQADAQRATLLVLAWAALLSPVVAAVRALVR